MPESPAKTEEKPGGDEVVNLLKDIQDKISKPVEAPKSEPAATKEDAVADYNNRKAAIMKEMNWTEKQFEFHEREKLSAAAPIMKEMALLRIERSNKDYDKLKDPFEKEVKRYQDGGRVITPELAEEIFYMVKGKEISSGRYKPETPESQPKRAPQGGGNESRPRISSTPSYEREASGGGEGEGGGEAPQVSDREKEYIRIFGPQVSTEAYVKMREEKKSGVRAISDKAIRAPDIDVKNANPADRELAKHWGANDGRLL